MARWALGSLGRSSSLIALAGCCALSCGRATAPKQSAPPTQPTPQPAPCADWGSRVPAFEPGTATPIATSFQLMAAVPRTPTERFRACTRPDVRVVSGKSQGFSDVPVTLSSALSRPFRAPATGIALASDAAGTKPLAVDNLLLVEVFDAPGSRVAAVYVGATAGSPVTLDGRVLERYGADAFQAGPILLGRVQGIAPETPLRLRVTSLDYGDTGAASDVYVVPTPAPANRERGSSPALARN